MSVFEKQNFSRLLIWKLNTKIQYHPHPFLSWISPHSSYSPYPPSTILDSSECLQNENCLHSLQGAEQNKIVSFIIYIFKIGLIDCNFKLRVHPHPTVVIVGSLVSVLSRVQWQQQRMASEVCHVLLPSDWITGSQPKFSAIRSHLLGLLTLLFLLPAAVLLLPFASTSP